MNGTKYTSNGFTRILKFTVGAIIVTLILLLEKQFLKLHEYHLEFHMLLMKLYKIIFQMFGGQWTYTLIIKDIQTGHHILIGYLQVNTDIEPNII